MKTDHRGADIAAGIALWMLSLVVWCLLVVLFLVGPAMIGRALERPNGNGGVLEFVGYVLLMFLIWGRFVTSAMLFGDRELKSKVTGVTVGLLLASWTAGCTAYLVVGKPAISVLAGIVVAVVGTAAALFFGIGIWASSENPYVTRR